MHPPFVGARDNRIDRYNNNNNNNNSSNKLVIPTIIVSSVRFPKILPSTWRRWHLLHQRCPHQSCRHQHITATGQHLLKKLLQQQSIINHTRRNHRSNHIHICHIPTTCIISISSIILVIILLLPAASVTLACIPRLHPLRSRRLRLKQQQHLHRKCKSGYPTSTNYWPRPPWPKLPTRHPSKDEWFHHHHHPHNHNHHHRHQSLLLLHHHKQPQYKQQLHQHKHSLDP